MKPKTTKPTWPSVHRNRFLSSKTHHRNEDLSTQIKEQESLVRALTMIGRVLDAAGSPSQALHEIAEIARRVTGTDAAQIFLADLEEGRLTLFADTNEPEKVGNVSIDIGQGLTGWAAMNRRPIAIKREPWNDPRFFDYPGLDERSFQSMLCVPLIFEGELLGVVNVRTRHAYGYTQNEANILSRIAEQVARAIGHHERVVRLKQRIEHAEAVTEVTEIIGASPYLEEILQLLVSFTAERLGYKVVNVRLIDEERKELVLRATQSEHRAYRKKRSLKIGESYAGRAVLEKRIITVENILEAEEYVGHDLAFEQGLKSMVCVPLIVRDIPIGVMTCYTDEFHTFGKVELRALEALAKQAAIAIEHAKLQVRSTLMQELHHRVKNNLQQIVSLLRLELLDTSKKSPSDIIYDSLGRIAAISSVHDLLSREDLDRVGIVSISENLAHYHQQAIPPRDMQLQISVVGENIPLSLNQATQVALILNELIQNAIKHGFDEKSTGEIEVKVASKANVMHIKVTNTGKQLQEGFSIEKSSNLGLQIVSTLTKAIGGKFSIKNLNSKVVAEITFPRDETE